MKIKICGLTRSEDALAAAASGADYLGFIFAPSARRITARRAAEIAASVDRQAAAPAARRTDRAAIQRVGVFVNAPERFIRETARTASLSMLQLHGDEPPEFCVRFGLPVIKALRVQDRRIFEAVERYPVAHILLEPYVAGRYGGTGVEADWALAAEVVRAFPAKRFFLAGGLGLHNARAAVSAVRPFAVDASSALERSPGVKDREKIKAFVEMMRSL